MVGVFAMKNIVIGLAFGLLAVFSANAFAAGGKITITKPKDGEKVTVPFEVCFDAQNLEVTKASKIDYPGKGHHHILIDVDPVKDAFDPNSNELNKYGKGVLIHLSTGGSCITVKKAVEPGKHKLSGVFTHNNHVPYEPIISDTITINVVPQFEDKGKK